jgi:NADH dehydrogenase FAD-containing subunit
MEDEGEIVFTAASNIIKSPTKDANDLTPPLSTTPPKIRRRTVAIVGAGASGIPAAK